MTKRSKSEWIMKINGSILDENIHKRTNLGVDEVLRLDHNNMEGLFGFVGDVCMYCLYSSNHGC